MALLSSAMKNNTFTVQPHRPRTHSSTDKSNKRHRPSQPQMSRSHSISVHNKDKPRLVTVLAMCCCCLYVFLYVNSGSFMPFFCAHTYKFNQWMCVHVEQKVLSMDTQCITKPPEFGIMRDLHNAGLHGRLPLFIESFLKKYSFMFN